jgi:hypothetical protein
MKLPWWRCAASVDYRPEDCETVVMGSEFQIDPRPGVRRRVLSVCGAKPRVKVPQSTIELIFEILSNCQPEHHSPFLSRPRAVADVLLRIAERYVGNRGR